MTSHTRRILVVLGATGNQGGSVARAFLNDAALASHWHVRDLGRILVGFYNSNILPDSYFGPSFNPTTGKTEFEGPVSDDNLVPFIDASSSTGNFVKALVLTESLGTILAAYDEMKSLKECIELLRRKTGQDFVFVQRTVDDMAAESPLGREAPESWVWLAEYGLFGEKIDGWKESLTLPADLEEKMEAGKVNEWLSVQDWSKAFLPT
ncbi:NmrA-like family protein [Colletotrichum salicis]|uniref:NmrA-like family protein n=1 Tax=Colletotrichum salicis TaxID=1209931 RepID=A0A135U0W9_9PEZI|nr:NmrA-like family protein [Colletotrichum salicis]